MFVRIIVILSCFSWTETSKLALWIDQELIAQYFGVSLDIFIIEDGEVIPLLQNRKIYDDIPPIPKRVERIKLTWHAGEDKYRYYFQELKSLDENILYDPLLSIPIYGDIPHETQSFEVTVPCTEKRNGLGRLTVSLQIHDTRGRPVRGSPLTLTMSKECYKDKDADKSSGRKSLMCDEKCGKGGRCNEHGECACDKPYTGKYCETVDLSSHTVTRCDPPCSHGGQCVDKNTCKCRRGYSGKACQTPLCRRGCGPHGKCASHNRCRCQPGWHGRRCIRRRQGASLRIRRRKLRRAKRRQRHKARRFRKNSEAKTRAKNGSKLDTKTADGDAAS